MSRLSQDSINKMDLLNSLLVDMSINRDSKILRGSCFLADEERGGDVIFSTFFRVHSSLQLSGRELSINIKQGRLADLLKTRCMCSLFDMRDLIEDEIEKLEKR